MDERLDFELEIDVKAAMLGHAIHALTQMDDKLGRIATGLDKLGRSAGGARSATTRFTEMASALSLVERAAGAAGRAVALIDKGADYAISAMGERSASVRAYTQLLGGDKKQANLEYYRAQQFAGKTDFTSEQIEKSQARLLAQGFRGKDLYATLFSAADLAAIMPGDKNQTLERVTMAMSQIKAKGKLQGEELTQQLAEAGLNTTLVKEEIRKAMGLKSTGDVDKKLSKGEINADVALPAIQRAILAQLGTKRAGEYATGSAGSLTALISNRDEAVKNLLKGFDADENLPAMERYKKVLKEQGAIFDVNSKTGKDLSLVVQDLANSALTAKTGIASLVTGLLDAGSKKYVANLNDDNQGRDLDKETARTAYEAKKLGEKIGDKLGSAESIKKKAGDVAEGWLEEFNKDWEDLSSGNWRNFALRRNPNFRPGKDLKFEVDYDIQKAEKEMSDAFPREQGGAGLGGGGTGDEVDKLSGRRLARNELKRKKAAGASGKSEYRGVFWGYDFDGVSTGQWAQPTLRDVMSGNHTTASAITTAISNRGSDQPINIYIQGYNRDKTELAREIADQLGRLRRSP